jgi:hypothetical protein
MQNDPNRHKHKIEYAKKLMNRINNLDPNEYEVYYDRNNRLRYFKKDSDSKYIRIKPLERIYRLDYINLFTICI